MNKFSDRAKEFRLVQIAKNKSFQKRTVFAYNIKA